MVGHRAKNLLACSDVVQRAGEQGRLDVVAAFAPLDLRGATLEDSLGTGGRAFLEVTEHALVLDVADDRAHLGRLAKRMADLYRLEALDGSVHKIVVDRLLHQPTGGVATDLPGVKGDRLREFVGSLGDVDVVEDHRRALAPQLEFHWDQIMTAVACHHAANLG